MSVMQPIYFAETKGDSWKTNISPSVNKILSKDFTGQLDTAGDLVVTNTATQDMAGGLVSDNVDIPPACTHFGMDIVLELSALDFAEAARVENDLKVTFPGGAQANGSVQWNDDKKLWQFGANDGSGWVDTTCTSPLCVGINIIQLRLAFDGKTWGFEGLMVNGYRYLPEAKFQNLPANQTNWQPGLHPQLQTEARKAPWYLREVFHSVRLLASPNAIPYSFN